MASLAFIGLGVMGAPMAGHLRAAGHELAVYNRTRAKAEAWAGKHGGRVADSPADAARGADAVFACVGNDDDLRAITLGPDGAFGAMQPGALFADHTTASMRIAQELAAEGEARGLHVLDAPVSGGEPGAIAGTLVTMCGGTAHAFATAEPYLTAYAARRVHVGPPGAGQGAKMANQLAIAGVLAGVSEAMHLANRLGLDSDLVLQAVSGGSAKSWQMENRWPTMARGEFDFGFAVDWMRKDLGLALDAARETGASLPVAAQIDQLYAEVQRSGGGRWDTSSLVTRYEK